MNKPNNAEIQQTNNKVAKELIIRYFKAKPKQEQMAITDSIARLIRPKR